ncbi:biotin/lipoate A/B protein ligase family protein [Halorientalis brevis]|uniref:Biotin/lipoate A/B protein ligase family protein n=1 Tax=Halorientalis brevis TaxID=1126241 RepID=A0ABD6CCH8_9EURY|nr:lipoate--protein ligase family protein [Halorientalis brevis]
MRVVRGRGDDIEADRSVTQRLLAWAGTAGEPAVRVWRPHRQVAFGPRDANSDGYEQARQAAADQGYAVSERQVGGRAVAYTGDTIAFARIEPTDDGRQGIEERYAAVRVDIRDALRELGVDADRGEPDETFCPGSYSLQAPGGKLVGIAQRVTGDAVLVAGLIVVDGHDEIADVLDPVYDALSISFDPDTVGSIERGGGKVDPVAIIMRVEDALVGDHLGTVEWVDDLATVEWTGE